MQDIRGIYAHFKGGRYEVFGRCLSQRSDQVFVLYKPLYNETGLWIRPAPMFFDTLNVNGRQTKRFLLTGPSSGTIRDRRFHAHHSETNERIEITQTETGRFSANL